MSSVHQESRILRSDMASHPEPRLLISPNMRKVCSLQRPFVWLTL